MRPLGYLDMTVAARVLLALPPSTRAAALLQMLDQAHAADRYRRRLGRAHPDWGNGTLAAVARTRHPEPEPHFSDSGYLECLGQVIAVLLVWRRRAEIRSFRRRGLPLSDISPMC